jgi:uncharacterized membrane protein
MQRKRYFLAALVCSMVLAAAPVFAQQQPLQEFYVGTVTQVDENAETQEDFLVEGTLPVRTRTLVVELDGDAEPKVVEVLFDETLITRESQIPDVGDRIVVSKNPQFTTGTYIYLEPYRLPHLGLLAGFFAALVLLIARWRGVTALAGLAASGVIIFGFIAPQLLSGRNPVLVSISGALLIVLASMGLTHGFSRRTATAIAAVLFTLLLTIGLGALAVEGLKLLGFGSEAAVHLRLSTLPLQDISGLLLAAIIIGTLGVVDDVAITQVTVVQELARAKKELSMRELFVRASNVGREHIAAVVNTLVLAYVGASLPLFILLYANQIQPAWVLLNSETIAEEIVRTLVGSIGLVLAVPIATLFAARVFSGRTAESDAHHERLTSTDAHV